MVTIFPDFGDKYLSTNLWIGWQEWRRERLQQLVEQMERIRERYYLSYPRALIKEPLLYQLVKKFDLVFNIRGASVSEEMGLVAVEFEGTASRSSARWNGCGRAASPSSRSKRTSSNRRLGWAQSGRLPTIKSNATAGR